MAREFNAVVTFNDAHYMVANEGYFQLQSEMPTGSECMSKAAIQFFLEIDETRISSLDMNQVVPYQLLSPLTNLGWRVKQDSQFCEEDFTLEIESTDPTTSGALDGTATVTVTSGEGPYIYTWSNGSTTSTSSTTNTITDLTAGTYTVTVEDYIGNTASISTILYEGPVECSEGMDVAIIIDYSASMGEDIENTKSGVSDLVNTIQTETNTNDYRLGLCIVDEWSNLSPPSIYNNIYYDELPNNQKLTLNSNADTTIYITAMEMFNINNNSTFNTQLNKINNSVFTLGNGVGFPEPMDIALDKVLNNNLLGQFRSGVARYVILITDALPGGLDDDFTEEVRNRIASLTQDCIDNGVVVIVLGQGATNPIWQDLATDTGGDFNTTYNANTISDIIESSCNV